MELKKSREDLMRFLELFLYVTIFTVAGIFLFGTHPEPSEVIITYMLMTLMMIYNKLADIYDKFK